jgi:hypothetical protein
VEDNIRMDLSEIGWEVVDWIHLAQYRNRCLFVVNTIMNLQLSLWFFLTEHHAMKAYCGSGGIAPLIL